MEIFLDTADLTAIKRWLGHGVLDGVTTNPSIIFKDGGHDLEERTRQIAELIFPRPLSVEVSGNDHDNMLKQGREFATWGENIVVKIPIINEFGAPSLSVIKALSDEGTKVNVTACLSLGQVILGAKAGGTYVSIFAGRVGDEGNDAPSLIRRAKEWLDMWNYPAKIIVGSVREVSNLQDSALAGAHILTIPPQFLEKWVDHYYTRATVQGFNKDAEKSLAMLKMEVKA